MARGGSEISEFTDDFIDKATKIYLTNKDDKDWEIKMIEVRI